MSNKGNNVAVWFEIPSADFDRATSFYESLFGVALRSETIGPNRLGIFPYEQPALSGCVISGPAYRPANDGPVIYLNCAGRLDDLLSRVEALGGGIVTAKTALPPGMGFFAHIRDSEGNRVGLHSEA